VLPLACLAIVFVAAYCFTRGWALFKGSQNLPKDSEIERERYSIRIHILPWSGPRLHAPEAGIALMLFGALWVLVLMLLVFSL
jgi:hypothetical protein